MTEFRRITPQQAQALREQGARVVDIRDADSYELARISGSQRLDNHNLADFIANADLDAPLIVTCYHGHASQSAAAYLVGQGFDEVYSLDGGFEQWQHQFPDQVER